MVSNYETECYVEGESMKVKIEIEGNLHDNKGDFNLFFNAHDMADAIDDVKQFIKTRIKNEEEMTDDEYEALQTISDMLYIEGLEW